MLVQHPMWQAMGNQLNGASLFDFTVIHHLDHFSGEFGMAMVMQALIHTGHRFDMPGYHHQIVTDDDDGDFMI